ncbi:DNA binding, HU-like domain protein [Pseudomonas phage Dolphis]|nr:DNA binding, HU-like domain protein [Pseudomonas phage Dolphis]
MNKQQLIDTLAEDTNLPKTQIGRVLDSLASTVTTALQDGQEVTLHGLGKFATVERKGRTIKSPMVGGTKEIPASTVAKFKPAKALKEALN